MPSILFPLPGDSGSIKYCWMNEWMIRGCLWSLGRGCFVSWSCGLSPSRSLPPDLGGLWCPARILLGNFTEASCSIKSLCLPHCTLRDSFFKKEAKVYTENKEKVIWLNDNKDKWEKIPHSKATALKKNICAKGVKTRRRSTEEERKSTAWWLCFTKGKGGCLMTWATHDNISQQSKTYSKGFVKDGSGHIFKFKRHWKVLIQVTVRRILSHHQGMLMC